MSDADKPFEIPTQMRDFADKSLDHARKAFDDYMRQTREAVSGFEEKAASVKSDARALQENALEQAEKNVATAMDFARQMVNADSPAALLEIQRDFLEAQMQALSEQSSEMTAAAQTAFEKMTKAAEK